MKTTKTLKLIVLFGLLCVCFARADIIHACSSTNSTSFTLSSSGHFVSLDSFPHDDANDYIKIYDMSDTLIYGMSENYWYQGSQLSTSITPFQFYIIAYNLADCSPEYKYSGLYYAGGVFSTTPPPLATQVYATINADGSNAVMNGDCVYGQTDAIWQMIYSDGSVSKYIAGGAGSASCTGGYSNFTGNIATWAQSNWWINGWTYNHVGNYYLFYWHHSWPPSNSCKYPLTGTVSDCMADASEYAIFSQNANSSPYDTWSTTPAPPVNPTITISSPASGTTITSNSTTLSGTYAALHEGELGFGYLHLKLQNPNSGIYSREYTTPLTGESGTFSTPLSNFGITENGTWNLIAQQELDANTFEDLSPSPTYTLIFNIGGNSTPYTFTNWNTWYTANSAGGYSAPSDFGNSIEGFFQPIFTNVYEFANNTLSFFNVTTAHDKGYQIGQIFPTAQAYLDNINVFFGGFPLVPFFEFMIVVMLGIFIVRTIFKFIPFFG